jgi:MFS family permease
MQITMVQRRSGTATPVEDVLEGFRFVRQTRPIRALLLLLGLVSLVGSPYAVLMPIFADRILHSGATGLGILMAASGVGALFGALTLAFKSGVHGLGKWVLVASSGFGVSLICFGMSRLLWLSALLLVPLGFSLMVQMASSNTLIQSMVPDHLRGRVMSAYSMMFMGMAPIGALGAGVVADHLGAPLAVAIGGAACIGGSLVFGSRLPSLRVEGRRLIVAQGMSGGDPPQELNTQEVDEVGPRA